MIREIDYFSKIYRVCDDETIEDIANKYNIEPEIIYEFNNTQKVEKGDLLFIPKKNLAIHIVMPGDTLESIAKKYNVTIEKILSNNNITSLFVGLKLYI